MNGLETIIGVEMKKIKFDAGESPEIAGRKKFTTKDLISFSPRTESQREFLKAYYEQVPFILQIGYAGTGKSLMALYAALSEVLDENTKYEKLIIVRSAVETRPIGFLPGMIEEKTDPYERPYKDLISYVLKYKNSYNNLKALNHLDFMLTTHIRGLTFDNCVLWVDEVQNMDRGEILSVLTRVGQNSRVLVSGDGKQDDLFRQKHKSGFTYLMELTTHMQNFEVIEYGVNDILRSELCKEIIIADSKIAP